MNEQLFIVDYASGFLPGVCTPDHVSVVRSEVALRALANHPNAKLVLGAGLRERTMGCGPLADMMRDALLKKGVPESAILENPLGHDTLSETEAAYAVVRKAGGGSIACATSRYHAPRVWCLWFFRYGVRPTMYSAPLPPGRVERLREYCKLPIDCARAIIHRLTHEN